MVENRFNNCFESPRNTYSHFRCFFTSYIFVSIKKREENEKRWSSQRLFFACSMTIRRWLRFFSTYDSLQCKGRSSLLKLIANFIIVALCGLFLITQLYKHSSIPNDRNDIIERKTDTHFESKPIVLPLISSDQFHYVEPSNSFFKQKHNVLQTKVDWHNYTHIEMEKRRKGPGEQGKSFKLTDPEDIKKNDKLNKVNGYWAVASDIISVNRSVADIRHPL